MNAIVDMIMEGIICKDCGSFIDGESPGCERNCGCTIDEKSNDNKNYFTKQIIDLFHLKNK